ncbi:LOC111604862 [Sergentomyia squamirostris]
MALENSEVKLNYPSWLTLDFFRTILQNDKNFPETSDAVCVDGIHIEPATSIGDNFMSSCQVSCIFRVIVKYRFSKDDVKTLSLIVKYMPELGVVKNFVESFAFPKEAEMYSKIIPGLEKIWLRVGQSVQFGPKCWYSSNDPVPVIVMDDLKSFDYKMLPRREGLGLKEAEAVISKIAKFHAASLLYYKKNGPYYPNFNERIPRTNDNEGFGLFYGVMHAGLIEMLEGWDFGKSFLPKLKKWKGKIFDTNCKLTKAEEKSFNVLNHGDAWTNNAMFKYFNGSPEVLFVDYQLCIWTSPAIDLLYIIFYACNSDIQITHFDSLIKFYHSELLRALNNLDIPEKAPTLEEVSNAVYCKGFFGATTIINSLPLMKFDPNLNINMEFILNPENEEGLTMRKALFASENLKNAYKLLLPFLDKRGFLDIPNV